MGIEQDRVIAGSVKRDDEVVDRAVRPKTLADYVGQQSVKNQMDIFIQAAAAARRGAGSCADLRSPGVGQDHAGQHHRQ